MLASGIPVVSLPESELIAAAQAGDESATAELCRRYEPLIWRIVRRVSPPRHLAEDATQAGYLGLLEAIHRFDQSKSTSLGAFARLHVFGAVREAVWPQRVLDSSTAPQPTVRASWSSRPASRPDGVDESGTAQTSDLLHTHAQASGAPAVLGTEVDPPPDPFTILLRGRRDGRVRAFVASLGPEEAHLVYGKFVEDKTQAAIAKRFRLHPMAVSRRLAQVYALGRHELLDLADTVWV